jgi:hypothetical protein
MAFLGLVQGMALVGFSRFCQRETGRIIDLLLAIPMEP